MAASSKRMRRLRGAADMTRDLGGVFWLGMALMFVVQACVMQAAAAEPLISDPVFRVFGTEQGLPSRQIQALAEDADGRIWIGTANGLVRFDGHEIVSYPARLERAKRAGCRLRSRQWPSMAGSSCGWPPRAVSWRAGAAE